MTPIELEDQLDELRHTHNMVVAFYQAMIDDADQRYNNRLAELSTYVERPGG
jgi:hypothetical protein